MRITLQYGDEEYEEALTALRATDYSSVLFDMDRWLRGKVHDEELAEEVATVYQTARDELRRLRDDYGLPGD